MTQQQAQTSARPGRMTAVMRAVSQASGPKILRIGVVQGGKVIDERLIKQRGSVTIGPSEKSMFVVPTRKLPGNFRLFEIVGQDYHINFTEGMTGRVALKTGISDLAALKAQAKTQQKGSTRYYSVRLTEDSRGKIVVGETTFLFQFVFPPPVQPRPQLPVSVQSRFGGDIDWYTTIVAAFSFLAHFFIVALVYSDWMDPIVDEDRVVGQLVEAAEDSRPPPPPVPVQAPTVSTAKADAKADTKTKAPARAAAKPSGKSTAASKGPADPGAARAAANAKAAELESELASLDVQTLGAVGQGGVNTGEVLSESNVPTGLLDSAAQSGRGAGSGDPGGLNMGSGSGSGVVKPGAGSQGGSLRDIGNTGGTGQSAAAAGTAKKVQGPKGSAMVGGAGVAGGKVANAGSVVARMRGRFRNCYQRGLNSNPEMAGSVSLIARIGPNGEVLSVGGGGGGGLGAIVPCLKAVVRGGGFSPPEGGSAIVSIPITFVKQ